jgi:hypothetical protein
VVSVLSGRRLPRRDHDVAAPRKKAPYSAGLFRLARGAVLDSARLRL